MIGENGNLFLLVIDQEWNRFKGCTLLWRTESEETRSLIEVPAQRTHGKGDGYGVTEFVLPIKCYVHTNYRPFDA